MPTYSYNCLKCDAQFDVIKPLRSLDDDELCSSCSGVAQRRISRTNFTNAGDWKPTYNPAFGCVVNSRAHQRELLTMRKGEGREMIEIGNEPLEKLHKRYDTQRQETRDKRWATADNNLQEVL